MTKPTDETTKPTVVEIAGTTVTVENNGDVSIKTEGSVSIAAEAPEKPTDGQEAAKATETAAEAPAVPAPAPAATEETEEQDEPAIAVLSSALDKVMASEDVKGLIFSSRIIGTDDQETASVGMSFACEEDASTIGESLRAEELDVSILRTSLIATAKKKKKAKKDKDDKDGPQALAQKLSVLHDGAAVRMLQKLFSTYVGDADYRHFMTFIGEVDELVAKHRTHVGKEGVRPVARDQEADPEGEDDVEDDLDDAPARGSDAVA